MKEPVPQRIIEQYVQGMNFDENMVKMVWSQIENESQLLDEYFKLSSQNQQLNQSPQGAKQGDDDAIMNQVIMDSLKANSGTQVSFETMNPEQRKRKDGMPCGLKNVGNTCYFNSLIQAYFFNSEFVRTILKFKPPKMVDENNKKLDQSIKLVVNLQHLFVCMIGSDKKYVDPTDVVKSICDDFGNVLPIGDQKDVGEFNHYLLSRIEEALSINEHKDSKIYEQEDQDAQSNFGLSSIFRQKSSIITSEAQVSKLFFLRASHQLTFLEQNQQKQRDKEEILNFIPLDVRFGNLYDSWDNFMFAEINEFKNDFDEVVKAQQSNWIKELPQTLSFQIQRVQYDINRNELVKINDQFKFDEEIYIDRFLEKNDKQYLAIRKKNIEIKEKQKKIKEEIKFLKQFENSEDFPKALQTVIHFVELQNSNDTTSPAYFGKQKTINDTLSTLNHYSQQLKKAIEEKQKKNDELEAQIQSSFNNLKSKKYILQSILIQEGMASSGHYYAYISDTPNKKWFKFNDIHVTEEKQDKVFEDAIGRGVTNAYLLMYVREDLIKADLSVKPVLRAYRTSEARQEYLNDGYSKLMNDEQRGLIRKENQLFIQEIQDYKDARLIDGISDIYSRKFEFVNEQTRGLLNKFKDMKLKPNLTLNLPIFIKSKQNSAYDNVIKWIILDSCLREVHPNKLGIFDQSITEQFKMKVITKLRNNFNDFKAPSTYLTQLDTQSMEQIITEYTQSIQYGTSLCFVLEKFVEEDFYQAIQGLQAYIKQVKPTDQLGYFYKMALNLKQTIPIVTLLYGCTQKNKEINMQILKLVVIFLLQKHFEYNDPKVWNVQMSVFLAKILEIHNGSPHKGEIEKIILDFENNAKDPQMIAKLDQQNDELQALIHQMTQHYEIHQFSLANTQDILFERITNAQQKLSQKFKPFTQLQTNLKDRAIPLLQEELDQFIK